MNRLYKFTEWLKLREVDVGNQAFADKAPTQAQSNIQQLTFKAANKVNLGANNTLADIATKDSVKKKVLGQVALDAKAKGVQANPAAVIQGLDPKSIANSSGG